MIEFENILCPTDFSESAENAFNYAISLARKYGAKIHLLHVVEPFTYTTEFGLDYSAQYREIEVYAKKLLDESVESFKKNNLDVEGTLLLGRPFVEIIKFAEQKKVSLIVMGTHGRTGIEHALLGSVAEKVVRKSPCPVLTVKRAGQTFRMP